ncbi:MAG TPA: site-specific DNA-methyltransferase [Candidatus Paceibacterota bacterium]|nr:site-specific DNA-methyltransferase [Candidatus Paceibacterota bacterium]
MKINKGDIFEIGNHVVGYGDSLDQEFVRKVVGKAKIKIILCDPPYGVAYVENKKNFAKLSSNTEKIIINDHIQTEAEYEEFTQKYLKPIIPHLEEYNACYIFNGDSMFPSLRVGMKKVGFHYGQMLIWLKNQPVMSRKDYLSMYELIAYGWFGKHKTERSKAKNVIYYPRPQKSRLHPTQKPIGLLRRIIPDNTKVGDVVYDPFLGSGSTALACEHLGRKCIGIEIDEKYFLTTIKRLEKLTKSVAIKI